MSKIDTNTHKEGHRLPPKNVPFNEITKDLIATTVTGTKKIKQISIVLSILSIIGLIALIIKYFADHDDSTKWGYVAALISFLLSVGGGAPMVGIAPVLAKANWVRPVTRISAIFSLTGVSTLILIIPLTMMLPPLMVDGIRRRSIWFEGPIYSPHIWDYVALMGLVLTGLALFYSAALPDFAAMREHSSGWRKILEKLFLEVG